MSSDPRYERALAEARAALAAGRLDVARAALKQASLAAPKSPQPWLMRADVAHRAGDLDDFQRALGKARDLVDEPALRLRLDVDRGWALYELGRRGPALKLAAAAAQAIDADLRHCASLGGLLDSLEAPELAAPLFERAAEREPGRPEIWLDLATVRRSLGELEAAEAACERAIERAPDMSEAHALLSSLRKWTAERNHVARLTAAMEAAPAGLERARLGYALFKELDDLGRRHEAWAALDGASADAKHAHPWSDPADEATVVAVQHAFPQAPAVRPAKPRTPRPIFVVGLPRSGTSLVERILDAHSQVRALGELGAFGALVNAAVGIEPATYLDAQVAARLGGVDWGAIGDGYREAVRQLAGGAAVTVDKLPQNWLYAGAIARALPDAVIVHTNRGAMDNLFGAYRQLFQRDFQWSYDLGDLAQHYQRYRRLTAHWRETLGAAWVEVDYEALASDPEAQIRGLLAACGLKFEAACLSPHAAGGRARSLSVVQLRQPINTAGIGAWRAYESELEPLRERLQSMGFVDAAGEPAGG